MMGVRQNKVTDSVEVGAPETGHQPAFDDTWSPVDIPDIINSRLDPSPRERRYRTKYVPPEQRRGPRQKGEFNSRHRRFVTKADNNYSNSQHELRYRKQPKKDNSDWEFVFGFIFFTLHGWVAIGMGIYWLVQYIFGSITNKKD